MMPLHRTLFRCAFLWSCFAAVALLLCAPTATKLYTFDTDLLAKADGKFKQRKYAEALTQYKDIITRLPKSVSAPTALYKIGFTNIYFDNPQPDWTAALKAFRLFQKQYGNDPKIDEVNTWIRILVVMESFAAQYGESSARTQKWKNKTLERNETVEQLREEFLRCSFEKDSLNLEKNALVQKIKELEATILKIEKEK
jgi:outer membrane protein assembly factor BamD (BamD/ComL family)